ncbi:MAG: transketolase C-terminal domain-containing protein, partial [Planctomycetota bacterium]|nr:transketolase C-terminal domain-containing protein [Planctomycetota bacterium]
MRTAFINTLCELARSNPRITLLTGDLGFSVLEPFAREFPGQYVNVGVAEQNLTGVAAGLALSGRICFTYSIANFPTLRCLEQIRNDVVYHKANVKVVAVGGGFAYGSQGYTHHGIEDLAVMRALPGMVVLAPADPLEAAAATRAIAAHPGPCYLRLGKAGEPVLHASPPALEIGRAIPVREGSDITLISTGSMLRVALRVADALAAQGRSARVLSMPSVKPLDDEAVRKAAEQTRVVMTLEEHSRTGGLGSAVAEVVAQMSGARATLRIWGAPDALHHRVGSQDYMLEVCGD